MDDTQSLVAEGVEAYKSGDKAGAVRLLTEALKRDPRNEQAWLYMGAALDDPDKRRQAFQRVLQINPDNERAKAALDRLSGAKTVPASGPGADTGSGAGPKRTAQASQAASAAASAASENLKRAQQQAQQFASRTYAEGFAVPVKIVGAPDKVNGPYIVENARQRTTESIDLYSKRDFEGYEGHVTNATPWDSVFIVGVGAVALAAAELIGRFFGFFVLLFGHYYNLLGAFIEIFTGPIIVIAAVGAGFAAAVYGTRLFLKTQYTMEPPLAQLSMNFAGVFLPMALVQAVFDLPAAIFGTFFGPLAILVGLLMAFYGWYLLKDVYGRAYGTENDRGMLTAALTIMVYLAVYGFIRLIFGV